MAKIADISHYQGAIDWTKARQELEYVIFRASVGSNADKRYLEYTRDCGIPYGVYHYVKAGTAEQARTEARFFVECANKAAKKPLIYFADIEYETQTASTTEAVCVAFLEELRALGCKMVGLYIGQSRYKWAGKAIGMSDAIWIPRYGKNTGELPPEQYFPKYPCEMWQYTSKGKVAGIDGNVDLDTLWHGEGTLEWYTNTVQEPTTPSKEGEKMLTNLMLAAYCELVYLAKWVYWYGTCGYACTDALFKRKKEQYPSNYTSDRDSGYKADIKNGRMCADCVGLIKSFFWKGGDINGTNTYKANNCPDKSADGMFSLCKERGPIATIPDIPGLVVHKSGHIGVYVGNGYTIEMRGFAYDCVKRKVTDGPWTEWGKLPDSMLAYVDGAVEPVKAPELGDRTLAKGCTGADVKALQEALMALGYSLPKYGADGDFGKETLAAVKQFQSDHGLEETGVFDTSALKALKDAQAPKQETPEPAQPIEEPDTPEDGSAPAYVLIIEGTEEKLRLVQSAYGGKLAQVDSVKVVSV